MPTADTGVVILGAGITGAFTAYFAARAGGAVTLVERDEIAAHASGNNAGGLNPFHGAGIPGPLHDFALGSFRLHVEHWEEIRRLSGVDFGAGRVTGVHVALDDDEAAALRERAVLYDAAPGFSARWIDRDRLREREGRVSESVVGALWTEGNGRVRSAPYTRAVIGAAVKLGARLLRAHAQGLRHRGGRVTGVELDSGTLRCDGVVVAPGPWCSEPAEWLGVKLPVEPVKGELLVAEGRDGRAPMTDVLWRQFGIYAGGGPRVLLGGTEERVGFDESPTASARERILAGIGKVFINDGWRVVEQRVGLRPVTPDGLPILGVPRSWENVCVAAGSGRKGMLLGAALGLGAAQAVTGSRSASWPPGFAPDRFQSPR